MKHDSLNQPLWVGARFVQTRQLSFRAYPPFNFRDLLACLLMMGLVGASLAVLS